MGRNRRKNATNEMMSGLSFTVVFGVIWLVTGQAIWLLPMALVGVLPGLRGIGRALSERAERRRFTRKPPRISAEEREKEILRAAQQVGGRVTPAIAALRTSCSIEEAEKILQGLAGKGYARAELLDSGRLEYQFPEFMDESDMPRA